MKSNKSKRNFRYYTAVFMLILSLLMPVQEAYAFNLLREIGRGLRKSAHFVVTLPDKVTRPLGPTLGPIASFVLTKNILKNPKFSKIFRTAKRTKDIADSIEDINKEVRTLKNAYMDEASKLRKKADELKNVRKDFAQGLLKGADFDEYKRNVADIQAMIEAYETAADKLENQGNSLSTEKFIQIFGNKFVNRTLGEIKDAVLMDVASDLLNVSDENLIRTFVDSGGSFDSVLDYLIERELGGVNASPEEKDDLRDRIRETIKDRLDENKDYLKDNWEEEIKNLIKEHQDQMQEQTSQTNTQLSENTDEIPLTQEQEDVISQFEEDMGMTIETFGDEFDIKDCKPGYRFNPRSGVGCVQINCNSANEASHYSYTGACICGSAGSINENPDDPNKGCYFPNTYSSCPGCLYSCVHSSEKCALEGAKFK